MYFRDLVILFDNFAELIRTDAFAWIRKIFTNNDTELDNMFG